MADKKQETSSPHAQRLDPLLRVLENGDNDVNSRRAEISTRVTRRAPPPVESNELAQALSESIGFDAAALQTASLASVSLDSDLTPNTDAAGELGTRKKKEEQPPADDCFVNVVIHAKACTPGNRAAEVGRPTEQIATKCDAILKEERTRSAKGHSLVRRTAALRRRNLISATIPISFLQELANDDNVAFVQPAQPLKFSLPRPSPASSATDRVIGEASHHKDGEDVLVGIIDVGGIDFSHPDFLDEEGRSRILRIWDQGGNFRPNPNGYEYGSEFTKAHLDAALATEASGGLPAVALERQAVQSPSSHCTHVASIAAGNSGVCPKADIAVVNIDVPFPSADADTYERQRFNFSDSSQIIDAVEYLLALADEIGKPVSINISLGTNGGSHDGASAVTRWLDYALEQPGCGICIAAGNAGQERAENDQDIGWVSGRIHSSGRIPARGLDVELGWVVVGNGIADISENELEIWYSAQDRFTVEVLAPGESKWLRVEPQHFFENRRLPDGTTVSIYNELYHPVNGANYIAIYLSPNLSPGEIRGITAGRWRVRLIGEEIRDGRFNCWVERDDMRDLGRIEGERFFRFPSFFTEESNVDTNSISSLACGDAPIAVANYDAATDLMNISSSQGPTRDRRFKPDICAPGTNIVAADGFAPNGSGWTSMTGTSMASPYVAGVIGLMLSANPGLTAAQCQGILQRSSNPLPGADYAWQNDAGFGRINPEAAITEAVSFTSRFDMGKTKRAAPQSTPVDGTGAGQ